MFMAANAFRELKIVINEFPVKSSFQNFPFIKNIISKNS